MKHHLNPKTIAIAVGMVILAVIVIPHLFTKRVPVVLGEETFTLEVADSSAKQQRGLSGRTGLATSTGMLFVFDAPGRYSFWMKDMLFPIDIIWLRDDWCLVHIVSDISPDTYPDTFAPPVPATYVVELAAGEATRLGLRAGACLESPAL